jgi:hypothetical protein
MTAPSTKVSTYSLHSVRSQVQVYDRSHSNRKLSCCFKSICTGMMNMGYTPMMSYQMFKSDVIL